MRRSLRPRLLEKPVPVGLVARVGVLLVSVVLLVGFGALPAQATTTTTTTRSCRDGGGVTWHTKVVWGATYWASGVTKVAVDYAGWTSTLSVLPTDSSVRTYEGKGRLVRELARSATLDYRHGSTYARRNPVNPTLVGAKIVITLGRDADGFGNCSVTHTLPAAGARQHPVVAAVGDMVCPPGAPVTASTCQQKAVSDSILQTRPDAFLALGDNAYGEGTAAQFDQAYHPTYGRLKDITHPIPGNHEYRTPRAGGYFGYFGTAAGLPSKGYYSFDIGSWHIVALNSEQDISVTGAQLAWLRNDLAAHPNTCTLALLHKPRFSSGDHGNNTAMKPFLDALVAAKTELLLSGHDHDYERFRPQTATGSISSTGITQLVIGTGGKSLNGRTTATTNSVVRSQAGHGWLQLTLRPTAADLRYTAVNDNPFTDHTTITCR